MNTTEKGFLREFFERRNMSPRQRSQLYCRERCLELARAQRFQIREESDGSIHALIHGDRYDLENGTSLRKWYWALDKLEHILEGE